MPGARAPGLSRWAAEATREQAEVFAAIENFRAAFEACQDFHHRSEALIASNREARARVLEAAFQTTEARRESERYRDLAERDPLTGLYNRRYVDEQLSLSLMAVRDGGPALAIAMIDLDLFKRVNDLRSHEAGDEVLRTVGQILSHMVSEVPGGVAARMGGEEFLLILPGTDGEAANDHTEAVRRHIAEHDWQSNTSGIPVTVSICVAVAPADGQHSTAPRCSAPPTRACTAPNEAAAAALSAPIRRKPPTTQKADDRLVHLLPSTPERRDRSRRRRTPRQNRHRSPAVGADPISSLRNPSCGRVSLASPASLRASSQNSSSAAGTGRDMW
jgi:diguanylate cyclase (GGDEF)-like protein